MSALAPEGPNGGNHRASVTVTACRPGSFRTPSVGSGAAPVIDTDGTILADCQLNPARTYQPPTKNG